MDYQSFKKAVIAKCEALGIAEYELYYQAGTSTSIDTFRHAINEFSASEEGGVCFRCIVDGKMGYASTEDLSEAQAAAVVEKAVDNAKTLESEEAVFLCEGGQEYETVDRAGYALPSTDELIATALAVEQKLYDADPMVIDGTQVNVLTGSGETAIYNSKGLDLYESNAYSGMVAVAVVTNGTEMSNDYQIKIGKLSELDTDAMVKKAVDTAKQKLGGDVAPTAVCPVVFSPDAMCSLLSVFSSIFSSEAAQKGLSKLADKEGSKIASDIVTLVDDPFHKENAFPSVFDAEGCPTHKKSVIENGVLKTLLYNLKTAAVAGKKTTGNAAKGGYDSPVGVRPFTMYLAGGDCTEAELLQKAGEGVYINDLSGLHAGANPISGDFSLQSAGFLIRGGEKTDFVKSFTVAGNFYDLLNKITAVADNVTLPSPFGSTTFGAPSVLVEDLSIAGK
ncbi:MAG: TldD/PmbA family protein [Ruminococcaceae bacterium]|nr:TldD/PmbA family protein [Oscillospiraceae bacterium]